MKLIAIFSNTNISKKIISNAIYNNSENYLKILKEKGVIQRKQILTATNMNKMKMRNQQLLFMSKKEIKLELVKLQFSTVKLLSVNCLHYVTDILIIPL